jgi:hypothetical protein
VILRLLSYNIRYGGSGRERALISVISALAPDLVILQEATKPDVVERVAGGTGMTQWGSRRGESLGFMSRRPVAHAEWHKPRFSRHAYLEVAPGPGGPCWNSAARLFVRNIRLIWLSTVSAPALALLSESNTNSMRRTRSVLSRF